MFVGKDVQGRQWGSTFLMRAQPWEDWKGTRTVSVSIWREIALHKCGARLFLALPSSRTRGNGQKLINRKVHLNMIKNFFSLNVEVHWPDFSVKLWISLIGDNSRPIWSQTCTMYSNRITLPEQEEWTRWPHVVPPNFMHSFGHILLIHYTFRITTKNFKKTLGNLSLSVPSVYIFISLLKFFT